MSLRTVHDFENPKKLDDPLKPPPPSKTNYEAYLKNEVKAQTRGYFQNDPQRLAVTKHSASFQVNEVKDILAINPPLKAYLEKQMNLEDKKLAVIRQNRIYTDIEVKLQMERQEKRYRKSLSKQMKATWARELN